MDYWRDMYDLFRRCARGYWLVHGYVSLCNGGDSLDPVRHSCPGNHSTIVAIPGKHAALALDGWVWARLRSAGNQQVCNCPMLLR